MKNQIKNNNKLKTLVRFFIGTLLLTINISIMIKIKRKNLCMFNTFMHVL